MADSKVLGRAAKQVLELAAEICDRVARVAPSGPSNVVREARAHVSAVAPRSVLEAFDRAVRASYQSGAAACAWTIREERKRRED